MPLAAIERFAKTADQLHDPIDVLNGLDRVVRPLDLRVYGAWLLSIAEKWDNGPRSYTPGIDMFIHSSLSKAYLKEFWQAYEKNGASPIAREARLNYAPLTWTELTQRLRLTGSDRWFVDLTRKHGMRDGLHCAYGDILVAFHCRKILHLNEGERALLNSAAQIAAAHIRRIVVARKSIRKKPVQLTPRERAALRWYALGEEPGEIATRMQISVGSVNTFLNRAKTKLGAKNRPHTILLAIRARLLTLAGAAYIIDQFSPF